MKKLSICLCVIILTTRLVSGQAADFTPYPKNLHSPNVLEPGYTASGFCSTPTWTITNGKIRKEVNGSISWVNTLTANSVDVMWDDVTDVGKLKASATCGSETPSVEKNFPICSLSGLTPSFPRMNVNWKNLDLCATASPTLFVDVLMMTWTGGVKGSPQERADGYE